MAGRSCRQNTPVTTVARNQLVNRDFCPVNDQHTEAEEQHFKRTH
jgi:hypothetical protein